MNAINLIGSQLSLTEKLEPQIEDVKTICAFTGEEITKGYPLSNLIKKTFTDHAYIRYNSRYTSINAVCCIEAVIPSGDRFNSLRNYSYFVNESELKLLKREEILDIILSLKSEPFVLSVTYSNKKHTSYKSVLNTSKDQFKVITDKGLVSVDMNKVRKLLPIIQSWYTVVRGKESTAAQPTYFTKVDILNGCTNHKKIKLYGIEKYFNESKIIQQYRNTAFLNLIVHILNKSTYVKS